MCSHRHNLGNDGFVCPLDSKDFCKLFEIMCSSLTNREDSISQPPHAESCQLLIKKLDTKLASQKRNVFDDGQSNAPLLIFCKLNNGW